MTIDILQTILGGFVASIVWLKSLIFGLILIAVKIFPRFFDMWIQSTYPNKLLAVEFVNGTIGSFVIGGVFAYVI